MARHISEILKELVESLSESVVETSKKPLREMYLGDVRSIVKEELKSDVVYQGAGSGFLTIEAICEKYGVSKVTVHNKCNDFNVERKRVGKKKLVHELQFLDACQQKSSKPAFLKKKTA